MLVGAGIATVWHLLEHGSLALKASGHGHSGHGKGTGKVGSAVSKVAGFDNRLVGGVGIGVGIPLTAEAELQAWKDHNGRYHADLRSGN